MDNQSASLEWTFRCITVQYVSLRKTSIHTTEALRAHFNASFFPDIYLHCSFRTGKGQLWVRHRFNTTVRTERQLHVNLMKNKPRSSSVFNFNPQAGCFQHCPFRQLSEGVAGLSYPQASPARTTGPGPRVPVLQLFLSLQLCFSPWNFLTQKESENTQPHQHLTAIFSYIQWRTRFRKYPATKREITENTMQATRFQFSNLPGRQQASALCWLTMEVSCVLFLRRNKMFMVGFRRFRCTKCRVVSSKKFVSG